MIFVLWDTESRNILGTFDSEAAALRLVREAAERTGVEAVEGLALVVEDDQGLSTTIAMGDDLINRVHASDAHARVVSAHRE